MDDLHISPKLTRATNSKTPTKKVIPAVKIKGSDLESYKLKYFNNLRLWGELVERDKEEIWKRVKLEVGDSEVTFANIESSLKEIIRNFNGKPIISPQEIAKGNFFKNKHIIEEKLNSKSLAKLTVKEVKDYIKYADLKKDATNLKIAIQISESSFNKPSKKFDFKLSLELDSINEKNYKKVIEEALSPFVKEKFAEIEKDIHMKWVKYTFAKNKLMQIEDRKERKKQLHQLKVEFSKYDLPYKLIKEDIRQNLINDNNLIKKENSIFSDHTELNEDLIKEISLAIQKEALDREILNKNGIPGIYHDKKITLLDRALSNNVIFLS